MRRLVLWLARSVRDRILSSKAWERQFKAGFGYPPPTWALADVKRNAVAPRWMRWLKESARRVEKRFEEAA